MVQRRTFLKRSTLVGSGVGLSALSGCLGDDDDDDDVVADDDDPPADDGDDTAPDPSLPDEVRIGFASPAMAVYKFAIWPALERAIAEAGSTLGTDHYGGHVPVAGGLISQEISTGYVSVTAIAEARLQEMPLVGIHDNLREYFFAMVTQPEINSWDDLEGGEIAIHAPVGTSAAISNYMVREELGEIDAVDYSFIIGSGSRAAALEGGEVDATVILMSAANQLVNQGSGRILANPWEYDGLTGLLTNVWTALEPQLDERETELQLVVDELQNAYDWLYSEDPETIVDEALDAEDYPPYERQVWVDSLEIARDVELWPRAKTDALDVDRVENTVNLLSELDLVGEEVTEVPADDIVNRRFLE